MRVKILGARGSIPCPGPDTVRYGGNTSCVQVTLSDGSQLVLDAGTGLRNLALPDDEPARVTILLTHLHLDHVQGLMFFAPLFDPGAEITIWGPADPDATLRERLARYLSAPLAPVELDDLPCKLVLRDCPEDEWRIGSARIRADAVIHRGPTLGFRITDDDDATLCYIPDHEPGLIGPLDGIDADWISGRALALDADLLVHDCQYTDAEHAEHYGWGHSSLGDALTFARRMRARRTLLTHHDPYHSDDQLDAIAADARRRWRSADESHTIEMARELYETQIEVGTSVSARAFAP